MQHLRANLWLLTLTMLICAVLYPLTLLFVGQVVFPFQAQGSLVGQDGKPVKSEQDAVGSRLIAQPFSSDEYFQPRPSAVGYNGAGSGASNWGASNPALRKRVIGVLGPMLKYRDGKPVGPDVAAWARKNLTQNPAILATWSEEDSSAADHWANSDSAIGAFLAEWQKEHGDDVDQWRKENPDAAEVKPADLAALFFKSYAAGATKTWPETDGKDLQVAFFEVWRRAHPEAKFQSVPSDAVLASGSGLDPNITLENAQYQLDRVAASWAEKSSRQATDVRKEIEGMLRDNQASPIGGLAGSPMVNVLELNLALRQRFVK